jgi:REP element-mobilizing transposase RayT
LTLFQNVRPFYFVTFNTRHREQVLAVKSVHDAFLAFCQRAETEHAIAVGRYVLMPDHVHFFVFLPEQGVRLSRWVGQLKRAMGNAAGTEHVTWQEGFFDHILRSEESYSQKWEYVRRNPERAGLCRHAEDWPWQGEIVRVEF